MKSSINIVESNLVEMSFEGDLQFNNADTHSIQTVIVAEKNKYGVLNSKFNNTRNYCIQETNMLFYQDTQFSASLPDSLFSMHFLLHGLNEFSYRDKSVDIPGGHNNIGIVDVEENWHSKYKSNESCKSFAINIPKVSFEKLANQYPNHFETLYYLYEKGETHFLNEHYQKTTKEMMNVIAQIRNADVLGNSKDIYIEAKVLELLALQLQHGKYEISYGNPNQCNNIDDFEKIHEAKRLLLSDLSRTPTIPELSRFVGINECKLKYGFKELYKQTVFQCLFDHKMELACKLLLDTDKTIFEIALECGYADTSHLTKAFKRKFGIAPRDYRNRH